MNFGGVLMNLDTGDASYGMLIGKYAWPQNIYVRLI